MPDYEELDSVEYSLYRIANYLEKLLEIELVRMVPNSLYRPTPQEFVENWKKNDR